jgi:hypothetical protein
MFLWPRNCITYKMSLVLAYSIVAFQCRNVWKVIVFSRGLPSFWAMRFLCVRKFCPTLYWRRFLKMYSPVFVSWFSFVISAAVTLKILGSLPFSGWFNIITLHSKSISVHFKLNASPTLNAVSFSSWRSAERFLPAHAISWSSSCSVGMNGIFRDGL